MISSNIRQGDTYSNADFDDDPNLDNDLNNDDDENDDENDEDDENEEGDNDARRHMLIGSDDEGDYDDEHDDEHDNDDDEHDNDDDEHEEEDDYGDGRLYELCVVASESERGEDEIWDEIREWFRNTSEEDRAIAIAQREQHSQKTPLHEACNHPDPPPDVIASLLACSPNASVARVVDQSSWIPLHIACNNKVSVEVIRLLVEAFPEGKTCQDQKGRTPLHFLMSVDINNVKAFQDKFFTSFLKKNESPASKNMVKIAKILTDETNSYISMSCAQSLSTNQSSSNHYNTNNKSTSGAANIPDFITLMLPIHYACAYGIPCSVIKVLVEAFPESIVAKDKYGRTPLHCCMRNVDAPESPERIKLLVERDPHTYTHTHTHTHTAKVWHARRNLPRLINMQDNDGNLPLQHLLQHLTAKDKTIAAAKAKAIKTIRLEDQESMDRESVTKCLNIYLDTKPQAIAKFLTGLQHLPKWLKDKAVVNPNVKTILNEKIAKRFPTMILMMDFYFLGAIIILFSITARDFIENYDESAHEDPTLCNTMNGRGQREGYISFLMIGASYFLGRELLQMLSLYSLGTFKSWITDLSNWGDVLLISLVFFFTTAMKKCLLTKDGFRCGTVITIMILSIKIISLLKSTFEEFAVFVNGVLYVVKRLVVFLVALFVILMAFSQIFFFIFHLTDECDPSKNEFPYFAHCTLHRSFLRVCASLMGEVDPSEYTSKTEAKIFFFLYVFIVIILLSNVLIAVVTDSYGVIKNERAAMVFWSNRLDFVAEMDAISRVNALFSKSNTESLDNHNHNHNHAPGASSNRNLRSPAEEERLDLDYRIWSNCMDLFFEKHEMSVLSFEYWLIAFYRIMAFFFIVPLWILLGFLSAGWLWPPQVRRKMLVQRVLNTRADVSNVISLQISELRKEVYKLRVEVKAEMKSDRQEIIEMKAEAEAVQSDVLADMMQIKEIMSTLLELRREEIVNISQMFSRR